MEIHPSSSPALLMQSERLEQAREAVAAALQAPRPANPEVIVELSQAAAALGPTAGS